MLQESPRFWYADPLYDKCCDDTQLHVPYTAYTFLVAGYTSDVGFGGGTGPGWVLTPGAARSSSSVRVVLHDSDEAERQGLAVRETLKALAPQLTEAPVNFMLSDVSSSRALRTVVDQAAATGHELGIIGFGAEGWCAFCSQQTEDANFTAWLTDEVRYARQKDIRLSAYTLMQGNVWGMDPIPEAAKTLNRDGTRGPTACFATDWHATYRQRVLAFAAKVGFYGVETDGEFEGGSCSDPSHDHHGVHGAFDAQLKVTQRFNAQLKARGMYQTGADAYVFSGANRWNAADTDEVIWRIDDVVEWSTLGRMYAFDSTYDRVPTSGQYTVDDLVGRCTNDPLQIDVVQCVDFVIGGFYLFGTQPFFHAVALWEPGHKHASELGASVKRWTGFFKAYRQRMLGTGRMLHLRRPTARFLEAVAHVTSDAAEPLRAIVGLVNPTSRGIVDNVTVSLYYAGLAPGAAVVASVLNADGPAAIKSAAPRNSDWLRSGVQYWLSVGGVQAAADYFRAHENEVIASQIGNQYLDHAGDCAERSS